MSTSRLLIYLVILFHFCRVQRFTKRSVIHTIIVIILSLLLFCLFITSIVVAKSDLPAKQLDIDHMHVEFETNEDLVLLDANVTVRVTTTKKGILKLSPKLATFDLSSNVVNHHLISVMSTSTFKINKDEQLMVLRFKNQTYLTKEEMRVFQKKLHVGSLWMTLSGDFRWHVKNAMSLVFGNSFRHTHFSCDIIYADVLKIDIHLARCDCKQ